MQRAWRASLHQRQALLATCDPEDEHTCSVCMNLLVEPVRWPGQCGHAFCRLCSYRCSSRAPSSCPLCRAPLPDGFGKKVEMAPECLQVDEELARAVSEAYPKLYPLQRCLNETALRSEREAVVWSMHELPTAVRRKFFAAPSGGVFRLRVGTTLGSHSLWLLAAAAGGDGRLLVPAEGGEAEARAGSVARILKLKTHATAAHSMRDAAVAMLEELRQEQSEFRLTFEAGPIGALSSVRHDAARDLLVAKCA